MTDTMNDRYKVNQILTVLFILGIAVSLYSIYSLPSNLRLSDGYQPEFVKVYIAAGFTFLLGSLTLTWALRYKKEIIVFRDRVLDKAEAEREAAEHAGKTTISLENVKTSLNSTENIKDTLQLGLQTICKQIEAGQGALYLVENTEGKRKVSLNAGYALNMGESAVISYEFGEGLIGQAAATGQTLYIDEVPEGYINIISGLGSSSPKYLLIVPLKKNEQILGVVEIASFLSTSEDQRRFIEESAQLIAEKILSNT